MIKSQILADFTHGFLTKGEVWGEPTVQVKQVHGNHVLRVDENFKSGQEADSMLTNKSGINLAIRTADCVPILFACRRNRLVAAAHAGWRGAYAGIVAETAKKMKSMGAVDMVAVIGPAIGVENYEVGEDFPIKEHLIRKDGTCFFDLKSYVKEKLHASGIMEVDVLSYDTYVDANLFYSYRRATHQGIVEEGRMLSVIKAN